MQYRIPPTHCLTAFEALVRLGTVVQAADELHVTPSAISHRLRQLEDSLGVKLLHRTGNEFTLTVEGKQYLEKVRQGLALLHQAPASKARARPKQWLRLAVTPTFARQVLLPKLPDFQQRYPDIELIIQVSIPFLDVKAEACDVEIRYGSGPYAGVVSQLLCADSVTPVCSPLFLQHHGPIGEPNDLAHAVLLRSPLSPWKEWFAAANLDWPEPTEGMQFNDVGLMLDAAANGQGVALTRVKLGRQWLERGGLVRLFAIDAPSAYGHYLTYANHVTARWECQCFIDWALQTLTIDRL
ncbi:LysR substrate-binding domain-containing protein [Parvibium lacunae]|uniref:LysR family transcriptional regulator n=1 Tax=Parvibium lacunae TaxID=1888893 RepID=A0A368L0Y1_9BURK|nr:LysR substrate-binding domain-containing protein [Parvibium lacunae]RCS56759.1 LysR family transcriptional regulator [Parvibium lacunae]